MNRKIIWHANLEDAVGLAQKENKAILLDFSNPG